jgi:hypothetical protein
MRLWRLKEDIVLYWAVDIDCWYLVEDDVFSRGLLRFERNLVVACSVVLLYSYRRLYPSSIHVCICL